MKYVPLFAIIQYKKGSGLDIRFNNEMRPYLLDIFEEGKGYTRIAMKQLFYLSSAYGMRLLELMLQYQGFMQDGCIRRHIKLEDLRFMLNVDEEKYQRIQDFCKRILDLPIKEINEKTQYKLSYTKTKTGRKITGFDFVMDCSDVLPETSVPETVQVEMLPNKSFWHGLTRQAVDKLTIICGSNEEFEKRMQYAVTLAKRRNPKNVTAFLYRAIEETIGGVIRRPGKSSSGKSKPKLKKKNGNSLHRRCLPMPSRLM